jgi:hypothetical protein
MVKQAFLGLPNFGKIMSHGSAAAEESLKQDPKQTARDYQDMVYYFGEKGRELRASKENMTKKAFWDGFEKRSALPEHSLKNVMLAGIPLGALAGSVVAKTTEKNPGGKRLRDSDIHPTILGALIGPAAMAGAYGLQKSLGSLAGKIK